MGIARKLPRFTVVEFLEIDDLDPRFSYQLLDGQIVAMTPPGRPHRILQAAMAGELRDAVRKRGLPCTTEVEVGVAPDTQAGGNSFQADVVVDGSPLSVGEKDLMAKAPVVIVEVVSESTGIMDVVWKREAYQRIGPPLQHIVYVSSLTVEVQHWCREGEDWVFERLGPEDVLHVAAVGLELPLATLYADTGMVP